MISQSATKHEMLMKAGAVEDGQMNSCLELVRRE